MTLYPTAPLRPPRGEALPLWIASPCLRLRREHPRCHACLLTHSFGPRALSRRTWRSAARSSGIEGQARARPDTAHSSSQHCCSSPHRRGHQRPQDGIVPISIVPISCARPRPNHIYVLTYLLYHIHLPIFVPRGEPALLNYPHAKPPRRGCRSPRAGASPRSAPSAPTLPPRASGSPSPPAADSK